MRTERGLDRILNFGDAVVAIAITLLVLPLLELRDDAGDGVVHLLREHSFELFAFFLSFLVIGVFWVSHHQVMEFVTTYDRTMIRLQMLWLVTIAFLPFPTQLLGASDNDRGSGGLYIGTLLVSSACVTGLSHHIRRTPEIRVAADEVGEAGRPLVLGDLTKAEEGTVWVTTGWFAVAFVVVLATPIGMWAILVLLLDSPTERLLARRRRARSLRSPETVT